MDKPKGSVLEWFNRPWIDDPNFILAMARANYAKKHPIRNKKGEKQ